MEAVVRARDRLLAADAAGARVANVCEVIVQAFHDVAVFDRSTVLTTDPDTLLPAGGVVEGFDADSCAPVWDNELLDPDFNKYTQLARSHDPVATLADAVDGDLDRSPRYRKIYSHMGADDELRVAFVAGESCLAIGAFLRPNGAGVFTAEELADVRQLVPTAITVLRRALGRMSDAASSEAPVMVILDAEDRITATTPGAQRVLDALRGEPDLDGDLPTLVRAAATKARWSRASTNITTRILDGSGRWLSLHVAPIEGEVGAVALLVETAPPKDIARLLLDSYGLTPRETEIVLLLARGRSLKEIASELMLSVHTVRDHVKMIYEKAGVNSRGELVADLFSNHVIHRLHSAVSRLTPTSTA